MKTAKDLKQHELIDIVNHLQGHLYLEMAGSDDEHGFAAGTDYWEPDKNWSIDLLESLAGRLAMYGLVPEKVIRAGEEG